jgi:1,3-beta-glucan synthase
MSGHPQQGHYDDGYGHHQGNTDSYYQDDQAQPYYDNNGGYADGHHEQGGDGYYDESYALPMLDSRTELN